jgi:histone demethylase JARID1
MPIGVSDKPTPTFFSSLSIAVEGAVPIESDISHDSVPLSLSDASQHAAATDPKRAPRKSKTDALVALRSRTRSPSVEGDDHRRQSLETDFSQNLANIPVTPALDMSTIKTATPRNMPHRTEPRPFDLEDCPVFYPNAEEFKDPMAYIRSISGTAQHFGICKIVPPEGWKMPFVTDTEV